MQGSEARPQPAAENTHVGQPPSRGGWLRRRIGLHAYIPETVVLVGVMAVLNLAFMPARPGFLGIEPNPFWAIILLMTARYGFRAALLSSLLAAGTYMALVATRVAEQVVALRDLMSWTYAKPAVLFIVVGVPLGMLVQRHRNRVARLEQDNDLLIKDNLTLKRGEQELQDVNVELANRVVGATDTLPMLYRYAKKLNNLDTEAILTVLTELVVEVTRARQVSVYRLVDERLRLHARNGSQQTGPDLLLEPAIRDAVVDRRMTLTLHDLLRHNIKRDDLFLCGPLTEGSSGQVAAVLAVEELDFLRYNPATIRLFDVIVDWACASLEQAARFADKPEERRMVQAKTTIIRAKRAGGIVAGEVEGQAAPGPPIHEDAAIISGLPTSLPEGMPVLSAGPLAPATSGAALGDVLRQTESSLFDGMTQHGAAEPTVEPEGNADPRDRALLQHMLDGELQIAGNQGTPLARLLNEIDGYMMARKGGGSDA